LTEKQRQVACHNCGDVLRSYAWDLGTGTNVREVPSIDDSVYVQMAVSEDGEQKNIWQSIGSICIYCDNIQLNRGYQEYLYSKGVRKPSDSRWDELG